MIALLMLIASTSSRVDSVDGFLVETCWYSNHHRPLQSSIPSAICPFPGYCNGAHNNKKFSDGRTVLRRKQKRRSGRISSSSSLYSSSGHHGGRYGIQNSTDSSESDFGPLPFINNMNGNHYNQNIGHHDTNTKTVTTPTPEEIASAAVAATTATPPPPSGAETTADNYGDNDIIDKSLSDEVTRALSKSTLVSDSITHNTGIHDVPGEINKWTRIMTDAINAAIHESLMKGRGGLDAPIRYQKNREKAHKLLVERIYTELKDMSQYDVNQVRQYWDMLLPKVSYLGTEQVAKVYDALRVAYRAHRGQMRKSGEPFIIHPVEVTLLLAGLKMDSETVMAGLLHDTVEDTELTFDQIESIFGVVVKNIVEGETKVSKLPKLAFNDYADEQAENLRQMFVAMTDDYRIIIVKLADRVHNMRTLRHMKPHKQVKISRETLDIFAPLAHRMGIWQFKSELEDTAFMYLYPDEYKRINKELRLHQKKFRDTLNTSREMLIKTLSADSTIREKASFQVYGRTKEVYSLWHKMQTKGESNLDNIMDVVALRVILMPNDAINICRDNNKSRRSSSLVTEDGLPLSSSSSSSAATNGIMSSKEAVDNGVWLCYHVLGLVQNLPGFHPVHDTKVKDYISFPKPNGYQSLHTVLMHGPNGQTIEIQIRTSAMHQVAEYGMASHWAYTDRKKMVHSGDGSSSSSSNAVGSSMTNDDNNNNDYSNGIDINGSNNNINENNNGDEYNTPWLSSIKEWQDDVICSRDFVDSVRRELLGKRVFVFLRNGKILNLARGATAVDAAFAIHTEIGLTMVGVEINSKTVPFSYELNNGDVVSILTDEYNGKPTKDWMRYAKSRSTRSKLRTYFRNKE